MEQIPFYNFDELSEDAKKKAISKHRDINVDYDKWWEDDAMITKYEEAGVEVNEVYFDIYKRNCYWKEYWIDSVEKFLTASLGKPLVMLMKLDETLPKLVEQSISIHERRENTPELFFDEPIETEKINSKYGIDIEEKMTKYLVGLDRQTLGEIENTYEYLTSDEAIAETLRANEYLFNNDGTITL